MYEWVFLGGFYLGLSLISSANPLGTGVLFRWIHLPGIRVFRGGLRLIVPRPLLLLSRAFLLIRTELSYSGLIGLMTMSGHELLA